MRPDNSKRPKEPPERRPTPSQTPTAALMCLADVEPERVDWLWLNRIPRGKLTVIDGDPGLGKSTLTLDLVARVSTGAPMPGEEVGRDPACAIVVSVEDGLGDTIRPRLDAAGADVARVFALGVREGEHDRPISIPGDLALVERVIAECQAVLVVIDPIVALLGERIDAHKDQDVRRALAPMAKMAERTGAAIIIVRHLNKAGGRSAIQRGGGSIGIVGAARAGLLVAKDRDDEHKRVIAVVKSNLGPPAPALRWQLVSTDNGAARVEWLGEVDVSADDLVAPPEAEDDGGALTDAVEWLGGHLAANGATSVAELHRDARKIGIADRTLRRARERVGASTVRAAFGGPVRWILDPAAIPASSPGHAGLGQNGPLGQYGQNGDWSGSTGGTIPAPSILAKPACVAGMALASTDDRIDWGEG